MELWMSTEKSVEVVKNIHQRLLGVMSDVDSVAKNEKVNMGKGSYSAVSHDDVARLLHPVFVKHGILCFPTVEESEFSAVKIVNNYGKEVDQHRVQVKIKVLFTNVDDPTDSISSTTFGFAFDSGDKAFGKAYSYAVKYALLKVLMLESRDAEEQRPQENQYSIRKVYRHSKEIMAKVLTFARDNNRSEADAVKFAESTSEKALLAFLEKKKKVEE